MSGMKWMHLMNVILGMVNYAGIPNILIIHCGANNIGDDPSGRLLYDIRLTLRSLMEVVLPVCTIIYSEMLPRLFWRFSARTSKTEKKLEKG